MKIFFIISSFLFLLFQTVVAQNPFITNYTIADGLPSNRVYHSCQDKNGFMWFGTDVGVVRFDGSNFEYYNEDDGLNGNFVLRIQEDFSGKIWFFNRDGSVNYFYKNIIYNEKNAPFLAELKTNFFLFGFFQDKDSTLYFYNYLSEVSVVKNNILIDYRHFDFRKDIGLFFLDKSEDNQFLLWTARGEYRFNKIDDNINVHRQQFRTQRVFKKSTNENYVLDRAGNIHLLNDLKIVKRNILKSESHLVNDIIEDKDGYLWVSTFNKGVYCYDGDSIILHLDIARAQNLIIDNENNIWIVSDLSGIYKVNRDILKYKFFGKVFFDGFGITDLARSNQEGIWATNGKSLFHIRDKQIFHRKITVGGSILNNIYQLKNNTIILSGTGANVHVVENVRIENNTINYDSSKILDYRVSKIAIDTTESFLYSYLNDLLTFINLKKISARKFIKFNRGRINNVFYNNKNKLNVNTVKNYTLTNTDTILTESLYRPFNGQVILSHIILDNENELISVMKNKLFLLNNDKFYDLTSQFKSQIDYRIINMIYDGSTLFFFTIKTVYFISNPLKILSGEPLELNRLNIEFNNINDLYCKDSTLYVASDDGLIFIPVDECFNAVIQPTRPYIYKISLDEENYDISSGVVEYKDSKRLSIEFSSLNYSSIPSNYSYMLEGVDESWITGNETRVVYLNVAPGSYTFKLKSRKNRENYSEVIELPVIVHPTIFQRTITKVFLVLLLLIIIYLAVRVSYRRKMKQKETEHLLITLENKALQSMMNPHFIFNALGSIQGFLLQNKSVEAGTYLSQFARLIRQNMNSLKSNFISIDDEVDRLRNYIELEKLRMNNKFICKIEVDDQLDSYDVCIPSMVVQPFVENAIWHGISSIEGDGLIKIIFNYIDEKSIEVLVEDNGIGISDLETTSQSRQGLNMGVALTKKRLKLIGEQHGVNSEIVTKNITPGDVQAGTQVKIIIPIVNCAL